MFSWMHIACPIYRGDLSSKALVMSSPKPKRSMGFAVLGNWSSLKWKDTLWIRLVKSLRGDCSVILCAHPWLIGSQGVIVAKERSGNVFAISAFGLNSRKPFVRCSHCHRPSFYTPTAPKSWFKVAWTVDFAIKLFRHKVMLLTWDKSLLFFLQ